MVAFPLASAAAIAFSGCTVDYPTSCTNSTPIDASCCFEAPGGVLLLTQFWDYDPSTGGNQSFTLHGLWPDNCDGTYGSYCQPELEVSNITKIIGEWDEDLLEEMKEVWPDYEGDDNSFWEHEFNKHATCVNTINPSCYANYEVNENVYDFFRITVNLHRQYPTYDFLAAEGIVPDVDATYTSEQIDAALKKHYGYDVYFSCDSNKALNQIWYFHHLKGPLTNEDFVKMDRLSNGGCPATGIKYIPKGLDSPSSTTSSAVATPTGTDGVTKGYLNISEGCIISYGKYFTTGTCATFKLSEAKYGGVQLVSSKGTCHMEDGVFACNSNESNENQFSYENGLIGYNGKYKWCIKGDTDQKDIYISDGTCQEFDISFAPF